MVQQSVVNHTKTSEMQAKENVNMSCMCMVGVKEEDGGRREEGGG